MKSRFTPFRRWQTFYWQDSLTGQRSAERCDGVPRQEHRAPGTRLRGAARADSQARGGVSLGHGARQFFEKLPRASRRSGVRRRGWSTARTTASIYCPPSIARRSPMRRTRTRTAMSSRSSACRELRKETSHSRPATSSARRCFRSTPSLSKAAAWIRPSISLSASAKARASGNQQAPRL